MTAYSLPLQNGLPNVHSPALSTLSYSLSLSLSLFIYLIVSHDQDAAQDNF